MDTYQKVKNGLKYFFLILIAILYTILVIAFSFGSVIAGILTLIPADLSPWNISKPNVLGYYSICSFAPFSTIMLFGMALIGFSLLKRIISYWREKYRNLVNSQTIENTRLGTSK